jgi:hypothetical protein
MLLHLLDVIFLLRCLVMLNTRLVKTRSCLLKASLRWV